MDTNQPSVAEEEAQPTKHHTPSPEPPKLIDQPESSKRTKKHKKPNASPEPSDSKSSSTSLAYKGLDNFVPTTERVLAKTLQGFNEFLYAQIDDDLWEKHEEDAASYDDLKAEIEGFHD
ncbi:hypothetical protein Tco_0242386 [Tanacetum coccineum]